MNYHPRIPKLYGLLKPHKTALPIRPIISGIDSGPHQDITKMLPHLLGTIGQSH